MKNKKCVLLDKLLDEGWFDNRDEVRLWIMERRILVNNEPAVNCFEKIPADSEIRVKEYYKRVYVNKGGLKLAGALRDFDIDVRNMTALDCGASTGGFTDCLLHAGAAKVYAVDAGHDQLAGKLAIDPRVVNLERTNLGDDKLCHLNPVPTLFTLDLSYLSLVKALPICKQILCGGIPHRDNSSPKEPTEAFLVCLVKPIYEVASSEIRRSGQINNPSILQSVLKDLIVSFTKQGARVIGLTNSPVRGNNGVVEFFLYAKICTDNCETATQMSAFSDEEIARVVEKALKIDKFAKNQYTKEDMIQFRINENRWNQL